jgi:16S rRNA (adenine1518-N6/adenine1519-N6)-dimethyltransferase
MARQRLGQHFLKDAGWRERIGRALPHDRDAVWLEIGAGHGEMTRELARTARRVVAIELDASLVQALWRLRYELPNLEVAEGNVLALDLARLAGGDRFHVFGSLPYYITSPILHRLFAFADRIACIHLVIQLEVAARLVARPGRRDYGYLSVATQYYTRPEILLRIPPGAFQPRPKVASALVRLRLPGERASLGIRDDNSFLAFVGQCFAHKRKTLVNNLKGSLGESSVRAAMEATGAEPQARAEELSLRQFAALFARVRHGTTEEHK